MIHQKSLRHVIPKRPRERVSQAAAAEICHDALVLGDASSHRGVSIVVRGKREAAFGALHVLLARPGRLAWFLRRLAKSAGRHRLGDLCPGVLNISSYSSIIRRAGVGLCKLVLSVYSELSEPTQTCVCSWLHTCTKTKDNSMQKLEHKQSAHAQGPRTRLLHSSAVGHSDAHSQSSSNHSMMMMMFITIFARDHSSCAEIEKLRCPP